MLKVKVRWSGFIGSPGWSNFYFDTGNGDFHTPEQAPECAQKVTDFFMNIRNLFPIPVLWTVQNDVENISESNGELNDVYSTGANTPFSGTATAAPYSGTSGAVVTWRTAGVRNGRRVRGRTFLVPAASSIYQNDGTIDNTVLTGITASAQTLMAPTAGGLRLGVWARPSAVGANDGAFHPITSASVPDLAAVLRSRRG